jgi:dimethylamine monooxygenase subunit A
VSKGTVAGQGDCRDQEDDGGAAGVIHTPYDGSAKPFSIGLKPLDLAEWIDVDGNFDQYIAEKRRLYVEERDNVLVAEADTEDAQAEVYSLIAAHMRTLDPRFRGDDDTLGHIAAAGLLVQEDLVMMRKSSEGWRLVAASLCFPSAWNLREKFGKPLGEVHGPVPGFRTGTRNASMIDRMFDNLKPEQPVMRWNWSLYGESVLYFPTAIHGAKRRFGDGDITGKVTIRLERQTLRKLPVSGDILFTIRIYLDPLEVLEAHADGPHLAAAIRDQMLALSPDELDYKGLTAELPRLLERLALIHH